MIILPSLLAIASLDQFIDQGNAYKGQSLKTCTLLGCVTEAVVDIRRADLERPDYDIVVEFDGKKQGCKRPVSEDVSPEVPNCGDAVRLVHREIPCDQRSNRNCDLMPKIEEHLAIFGTPATITVTLFQDGKEVATATMQPNYRAVFPNGRDCDGECKSWRTLWTIPGE